MEFESSALYHIDTARNEIARLLREIERLEREVRYQMEQLGEEYEKQARLMSLLAHADRIYSLDDFHKDLVLIGIREKES